MGSGSRSSHGGGERIAHFEFEGAVLCYCMIPKGGATDKLQLEGLVFLFGGQGGGKKGTGRSHFNGGGRGRSKRVGKTS